jgi:hypothetical protein
MIDDARAALARGDASVAVALAEEHRHLFPRGQLQEERDAVAIEAMVLAGRFTDARARAGSPSVGGG